MSAGNPKKTIGSRKPKKSLKEIKRFLAQVLRDTKKEIEQTNNRDGCYSPKGIDPQIIIRGGRGFHG